MADRLCARVVLGPSLFRVVLAGVALAGFTCVQPAWADEADVSAVAATQTAPASAPATQVSPKVHAILRQLEQRGDSIQDLAADLRWTIFDEVIEDEQTKLGQLFFKRDKPHDKFLIRFQKTKVEDQEINKLEEHLFDGRWYIEKREATKTIVRREVVRPGEQFDPFKVGQGPFPLPFGQKAAEILEKFEVAQIEPKAGDPAGADHLKLVPRGGDLADRYVDLHFYVDRKLNLPAKVIANQKDDKIITVAFANIKINSGIAGSRFELTLPKDDPTWSISEEPLPPAEP